MGLKSGSRDAGLDESAEDGSEPTDVERAAARLEGEDPADTRATDAGAEDPTEPAETETTRPTVESLPYTLRREKVNEGREQVPYFLRPEVVDGEGELRDALEAMLGEEVYKSDYREAAMVVAQRHPELVAEVLREWGYDLETA